MALRGSFQAELARHLGAEADRVLVALQEEKLPFALAGAVTSESPGAFPLEESGVEVGHPHLPFLTGAISDATPRKTQLVGGKAERLLGLPCTYRIDPRLTLRESPHRGPCQVRGFR
jgi:hypothetical protein